MRKRQEFGLMKRRDSKGKPVYYYYVYDDTNKRVYRSTGEVTKAKAMEYVLSLREQGRLGERDRVMIPFGEYAKDFFVHGRCPIEREAHMRGRNLTKSTLQGRRTALEEHILPTFANTPLSSITKARVNKWLIETPERDKVNRSSANGYLVTFRIVMEQALNEGLISENPCVGVTNLGNDTIRRPSYTKAEVKAIIGSPSDWDNPMIRTMCLTAAMTGMRIGEVRALKADCITDEAILIKSSFSDIDGLKTPKNGRERIAPIPTELSRELRSWDRKDGGYLFLMYGDKPISSQHIDRELKKRLEKLKIGGGKTFHSFRSFFNTEMMAANVNETILRSIIGHQSADMTEHYLHMETGEFKVVKNAQNGLYGEIMA